MKIKLYAWLDSIEHFKETQIQAINKNNDNFDKLCIFQENGEWTFKYLYNDNWNNLLDPYDRRYLKTYKSWKSLLNKIKQCFDNIEIKQIIKS